MRITLLISLLILHFFYLQGQINKFYFGIDFGINKSLANVHSNDRNYFSCFTNCWNDSEDFLNKNGTTSIHTGIEIKNKINISMEITRMFLLRTAQFNAPDLSSKGEYLISSAYFGARPQFKWTIAIGKRIDLGKKFDYLPQLQSAYMFVKNDIDTIYKYQETFTKYKYQEEEQNLSTNQFLIGIKNTFYYTINNNFRITSSLAYNQGLETNYSLRQKIIALEEPKNVYNGHTTSNLSHFFFTIGFEYFIQDRK